MTIHHQRSSRTIVQSSRRGFLRGLGVAVALPALETLCARSLQAEARVLGTTATGAPLRMAFMSIPNGVQQAAWFPSGVDRDFQLNRTMASLLPLKDHLQVIAGLGHENATSGRDGPGDHARASATFLTGARARKTAGKDIHVGISVDQVAAQHYGRSTRLPSLELSCDAVRNSGGCDSGYACAYQYNLSWSSPSTPVSPETNPRLAFERLFGAGSREERRKNLAMRRASERSVLDFVLEESRSVQRELGHGDRHKLDEYFSVVRELEQRLTESERFAAIPEVAADAPAGVPGDFAAHMNLMYDLIALAFETDSTRIATLILAYDGSNRVFQQIGIPEGHHYLTHNQTKADLAEKVAKIDAYYMECLSRFLKKLDSKTDVDGHSLLHNSMIVYGGAIADGNRHTHHNLPVILAGHAGGAYHPGRYWQVSDQPMSNLFVDMLQQTGVAATHFGDSTGRLTGA